jgi:exodeoxyribonuclease X
MLPFGKHRGLRISQVPPDYLHWMLANCTRIDTDLRQAIEDQLKPELRG